MMYVFLRSQEQNVNTGYYANEAFSKEFLPTWMFEEKVNWEKMVKDSWKRKEKKVEKIIGENRELIDFVFKKVLKPQNFVVSAKSLG